MQAGEESSRILVDAVGGVVGHRLVIGRLNRELPILHHSGSGRDELADDDVLLQTDQLVATAIDRRFGQHPSGLLERRRREP